MKNVCRFTLVLTSFIGLLFLTSCAYSGVTTVGKDHVVVLRSDLIFPFYGLFRKAYVCRATPGGLENCRYAENP